MVDWPWPDDAGRRLVLTDRLTGERYERDGDDVVGNGMYVSLPGSGAHLFCGRPLTCRVNDGVTRRSHGESLAW